LEQFSTSRRARQAAGTPTVQATVNTLQQQQQQQPQTSPSQSPSRSPVQSPGSMSSGINSNRSSPTLARSPTMQDYKCGIQQAVQQAAQYQHSLQQFAQSQMEQMNHQSTLNALNILSNHQGGINPLSSHDPLYDAPPATPIYTKSEESSSDSGLDMSGRCSTPKSGLGMDQSGLGKISSEDLLNFQASTEAQAFMLNTLNQLGPQDISDRIAAMGSLFGLDDYNFNLKQFTTLGGISPISCNL